MLPEPLVLATLEPAEATAVQLALVKIAGKLSTTGAAVRGVGQVLVTVMVEVAVVPGTMEVLLSVLTIWRAPWAERASVALAGVLRGLVAVKPAGAVTVAVLINWPVAVGATVPVTVKVTVPPTSKLTVVLMSPEPLVAATLEPAEATAVQLALVKIAGKLSTT